MELPPASGAYAFGTFCFAPLSRCTVNPTVGGFANIVRQQIGGDEVVMADASYSADIYTIDGGSPGTLIGTLLMSGTVEMVYKGRNPGVNPLGVFETILADFSLAGELGGNSFAGSPFLPAPGRPGELIPAAEVPEPGTGWLGRTVLLGLAGLTLRRWR